MKPFTNCAVSSNPLLSMAWSLDTDGFLNALTRMVARRGWPRDMLSNNGTNFIGRSKEINQLVKQMDQDKIQRMMSNKGINWHWNPPAAPHFGGVFERMIRSVKQAVNAVLGNADVSNEELQTTFTGVESLMNSRPLAQLSHDPNDEPVLTPNHFLVGHMSGELAPENVDTTAFNPQRRWRRVQELICHVWKRWMKEYLTSIGARKKWHERQRNINKGKVVLVIDANTPRRQWKVGRIVETFWEQMALFELWMSRLLMEPTEGQFRGFLRLNFRVKRTLTLKFPR